MDLDGLGLLMLRNNPVNIHREDSVFAVGSGDVPIFGERESSAELAASDSSMFKLLHLPLEIHDQKQLPKPYSFEDGDEQ